MRNDQVRVVCEPTFAACSSGIVSIQCDADEFKCAQKTRRRTQSHTTTTSQHIVGQNINLRLKSFTGNDLILYLLRSYSVVPSTESDTFSLEILCSHFPLKMVSLWWFAARVSPSPNENIPSYSQPLEKLTNLSCSEQCA